MGALPPSFCLHLKLQFWTASFHVLVYVSYVVSLGGTWWEPTWLLKLVMALYNLWGLRRLRSVWRKWSLNRLGILSPGELPESWSTEKPWSEWSREALRQFSWCDDADLWEVLKRSCGEPSRPEPDPPPSKLEPDPPP